MHLLEISDLVVAHDPRTLERLPVRRDEIVARLTAAGAAAWGSLPAATVAAAASVGVLLVEPLTHRRWYAVPL